MYNVIMRTVFFAQNIHVDISTYNKLSYYMMRIRYISYYLYFFLLIALFYNRREEKKKKKIQLFAIANSLHYYGRMTLGEDITVVVVKYTIYRFISIHIILFNSPANNNS